MCIRDSVNDEIEAGEREAGIRFSKAPTAISQINSAASKRSADPEKEIKQVEKNVARLDGLKKALTTKSSTTTDTEEGLRVLAELETVTAELSANEDRWAELHAQIEGYEL